MSNDIHGHDTRIPIRRVDLKVIWAKLVDSINFHMLSAFAYSSVAALAFATLDLAEGTVHPHKKDVERQ